MEKETGDRGEKKNVSSAESMFRGTVKKKLRKCKWPGHTSCLSSLRIYWRENVMWGMWKDQIKEMNRPVTHTPVVAGRRLDLRSLAGSGVTFPHRTCCSLLFLPAFTTPHYGSSLVRSVFQSIAIDVFYDPVPLQPRSSLLCNLVSRQYIPETMAGLYETADAFTHPAVLSWFRKIATPLPCHFGRPTC